MRTVKPRPAEVQHHPNRTTWFCLACGQPWPCAERKASYLAEYEASRDLTMLDLALLMASWLARAARHLTDLDDVLLYVRFMGWIPTRGQATNAPDDRGERA